ncbi:MAG: hypothetical protein QOE45_747 [Frankiaceae bacterium]|jgi:hypothetical protein|nr:hypothetical protein [Frankiaceae bacterium]
MGGNDVITSNLFYDLVSIQYHALKGQELYQRFTKDAEGRQDIAQFFEEVRRQDVERAARCHALLSQLSTGGGEPYPTGDGAGSVSGQDQMAGSGQGGGMAGR